jgi:hypothetical protein
MLGITPSYNALHLLKMSLPDTKEDELPGGKVNE